MSLPDRFSQLLDALGLEIVSAQAGSTQGQFPILDLLGNLRDAAAENPAFAAWQTCCAEAWEQMVRIVESGQAFQPEEIAWLHELLKHFQTWSESPEPPAVTGEAAGSAPVENQRPESSPPPAAAAASETPEAEPPLMVNIGEDGDLLREFIAESREHLDNIERGVLVLE